MPELYDIEIRRLNGEPCTLREFAGSVLLIVNVASRCGFTKQYADLELLYQQYHQQGLEILAFTCNQFAQQEPGDASAIEAVCRLDWGVTFPIFEKIAVNGKDAHPLYRLLKSQARGLLGAQRIQWNFTKFLVDRHGRVKLRFAPKTTPQAIEPEIKICLEQH